MTTRRHRSAVLCCVLAAPAAAQDAGTPSPYHQALQRANAAVLQRALRGIDVHEDHATWDKAWVAQTEHFAVKTTTSYGDGMLLALGLETMLRHVQDTLGIREPFGRQIPVHVLPDREAYNAFGNQYGAEHSSFYGSFYAEQAPDQPIAVVQDDNALWLRMQITHSFVHAYLAQVWPRQRPTWLDEGLAAYFSIYWDYAWGLAQYEQLKQANELLPLRQLLRDPIAAYARDTHARMMQLGMLFYWLLRFRDDTRTTLPGEEPARAPFRDWLTAQRDGRDGPAAIDALFDDPQALERELLAFRFPDR